MFHSNSRCKFVGLGYVFYGCFSLSLTKRDRLSSVAVKLLFFIWDWLVGVLNWRGDLCDGLRLLCPDLRYHSRVRRHRKVFVFETSVSPRTQRTFCDPPVSSWALYAHHYLTCYEISLDCSNIFQDGAQCYAWEEPATSTSARRAFPGSSRRSAIDSGVVTSPTWHRQQWNRPQSLHTCIPTWTFYRGCQEVALDYTGEARSWNLSANTWGQDFFTHFCSHQRHRILYCQPGVAQADN